MTQVKIGINGFGRIGKLTARAILESPQQQQRAQVVAINDPSKSIDQLIYMLRYDSVHGKFQGEIAKDGDNTLVVNGNKIALTNQREITSDIWA